MSEPVQRPVETSEAWFRYAEGDLLNEYITAGRYPGDLLAVSAIGRSEAEEAMLAVKRIQARVVEFFNNTNPAGQ